MLTKDEYYEKLIASRKDHGNFADESATIWQGNVDKLANEFEILFTFKEACAHLKIFSYNDHIELCMLAKEISTLELLFLAQWKAVERFGRTKYTMHAPTGGETSQAESTENC